METVEELETRLADIELRLEKARGREKLRKEVENLIVDRGYKVEDIFPKQPATQPAAEASTTKKKSSRKSKGEPMYVDPMNPENTYGGRGPVPKWLKEFEDAGGNREELRNPNYKEPTA